jgi:hypothetical protein
VSSPRQRGSQGSTRRRSTSMARADRLRPPSALSRDRASIGWTRHAPLSSVRTWRSERRLASG